MDQLGENIKQLARSKGITIKDLAEKIDMTETGYYASIRNRSMKLEKLLKISEVLEVPLSALVEDHKRQGFNFQNGVGIAGGDIHDLKIMPSEKEGTGGANTEEETGKLRLELELCKNDREHLKKEIALKDKIISMLEGTQ